MYLKPTTPSIKELASIIENSCITDSEALLNLIKESGILKEDISEFSQFDHDAKLSYGRLRVHEGSNFSIYVMSWSPGDFTAIHSHGISDWGAVCFFGNIDHRLYKFDNNNLELLQKSIVPKGTVAPVSGSLIHAMGNLSQDFVETLHIYGSNKGISNSNQDSLVFELEKKIARITSGSAFINMEKENYKDSITGFNTNFETIIDYFTILIPYYKRNKNDSMVSYLEAIISEPKLYFEK